MPLLLDNKLRATDDNNSPISGAKAYVYAEGTTTPVTTYAERALSNVQTHPVVANSEGYVADIFVPAGNYKLVMKDAADATLWEIDGITVLDVTISEYAETLLNDTTATAARATLGLGDLAVLDADAAARTALGLEIGVDVLQYYTAANLRAYLGLSTTSDVQFGEAIFRATSPIISLIENSASTQRTTILHDTGDLTIHTADPVSNTPTAKFTLSNGGAAVQAFSASLTEISMFCEDEVVAAVGTGPLSLSASYRLDEDGLTVSGVATNPGAVQGSTLTVVGNFGNAVDISGETGAAAIILQHSTSGAKAYFNVGASGKTVIGSIDSEVYVRDSAGNETLVSPHDFTRIPDGASEPLAWTYNSESNGRWVATDLARWGRLIEDLTGETLIYTGDISGEVDESSVGAGSVPALLARIEALEARVTALEA